MTQDLAILSTGALRSHVPFLRRYARALLHDRDAADALVADCLRQALSGTRFPPPEAHPRVWLLRLVQEAYEGGPRQDAPRRRTGAVTHWNEPVEARRFRLAFDRLASEDRQVLLLTGLEGLSVEETATVLGIDRLTVRVRIFRARKRMLEAQRQVGTRAAATPCERGQALGSAA